MANVKIDCTQIPRVLWVPLAEYPTCLRVCLRQSASILSPVSFVESETQCATRVRG